MPKAYYSRIALSCDKGRTLSEDNINLWLDIASKLSGMKAGARLLDIGCGTGHFAIPSAAKLGYRVTGADASSGMLVKAREKDSAGLVKFDIVDAHKLLYDKMRMTAGYKRSDTENERE